MKLSIYELTSNEALKMSPQNYEIVYSYNISRAETILYVVS